jgi:predicted Zn-ribbon and HTH transcriptional regulator
MPDIKNADRQGRTFSIRCELCGWKFRCPVEQLSRVACRACESQHVSETATA